jgi:hypothetical protein
VPVIAEEFKLLKGWILAVGAADDQPGDSFSSIYPCGFGMSTDGRNVDFRVTFAPAVKVVGLQTSVNLFGFGMLSIVTDDPVYVSMMLSLAVSLYDVNVNALVVPFPGYMARTFSENYPAANVEKFVIVNDLFATLTVQRSCPVSVYAALPSPLVI